MGADFMATMALVFDLVEIEFFAVESLGIRLAENRFNSVKQGTSVTLYTFGVE